MLQCTLFRPELGPSTRLLNRGTPPGLCAYTATAQSSYPRHVDAR